MATDQEVLERLAARGLQLGTPGKAIGDFLPWRREGTRIYLAGQTCDRGGKPTVTGTYGRDVSLDEARGAAVVCALNLLLNLRAACDGDLGRVSHCIKVNGFVVAAPGVGDYPLVINAATELLVALWGDAGAHARTSIGVAALPGNSVVEIDAIFALKG
jgi:enamine deaminase RidA (YjgF/YER057c/UK114 family)